MEYEERILCFLDILGFRAQINQTVDKDGIALPAEIAKISDAFLLMRNMLDIDKPGSSDGRAVTQFSDSIVISLPKKEPGGVFWTLSELRSVQLNLVFRGMLCRGAVVEGKVVHTDKLLFGPAMVAAYELESKAALYPRIILSDSLIELAESATFSHHSAQDEAKFVKSMLTRDSDGMWYIDYITKAQGELNDPDCEYPEYLGELCNIVRDGMKNKDAPIRLKFQWIKEKLLPHIDAIKSNMSKLPDGNEFKEAYMGLPDL
jgi:hypothetical protein